MNGLWERLDPGFFAPIWLAVGLVAMIAIVLLEIGAHRRRKHAVNLFAASHLVRSLTASVSPVKRLIKSILIVLAAGALFTALARPHLFFDWREENREGLDILLAVDCSKSMLSEDVKPSRLERAKLAVSDFADHLQDTRLGLIAFAGDSFLQCPLTIDRDAFQNAVRELDTDTIPRPGTDVASAIEQAVSALKSQSNNMKILILITDGEDLEGRAISAAKKAAQSGLKIYTVGVGTAAGDLIRTRDDAGAIAYLHDSSGQIVQSKLDESTLRQIASATGGAYVALGQRGEGLDEIYNRYIATLPRQHLEEKREKVRFEQFEWPLAFAFLCLLWEFLMNERAKARPEPVAAGATRPVVPRRKKKPALAAASLVALGLFLFGPAATTRAAVISDAQKDYKAGKYDESMQNYQKAAEKNPDQRDLNYNVGSAAYKAGVYSEAEESFRKALDTPDLKLQEDTYYNLGNTQYKHGEAMEKADTKRTIELWQQALNSYDSALKLRHSADAQYNYDLVKKKLEQLKQQQQQQQQQQQNQKQDSSQNKDKQSGQQSQQNQNSDQQNPQQGQQGQQPQDQQGKDKDQNGKPDEQKQGGDKPDQQPQQGDQKDQNGQQQQGGDKGNNPLSARSEGREQDQKDPGVKSRQEAENLLDSLKDDEHRITARALNGNNEPPPPNSGKDW